MDYAKPEEGTFILQYAPQTDSFRNSYSKITPSTEKPYRRASFYMEKEEESRLKEFNQKE